jgi:hypothetical protein
MADKLGAIFFESKSPVMVFKDFAKRQRRNSSKWMHYGTPLFLNADMMSDRLPQVGRLPIDDYSSPCYLPVSVKK